MKTAVRTTATLDSQAMPEARYAPFPLRAFLTGLVTIPLIVFWIEYTEIVSQGVDLASTSLLTSVVSLLLGLLVLNAILRRLLPRFAFSQRELLTVYAMNASSVGICSIGGMQFLVNTLTGPFYYKTPQNGWQSWMYLIKKWATPDPAVVKDYYTGHTSFFTPEHMQGWITPVIVWTSFVFLMLFTMYSLSSLLRKQWVEREKLSFPITVLPVEITQNGGATPIFRNRLMWGGFTLSCALESLSTLHYSFNPNVPFAPLKSSDPGNNLSQLLTTPPWNGMGALNLSFHPMAIGLTYFMPTDLSFSCWFFYLLTRLENVSAVALGFRDPGSAMARFPYSNEQAVGGFIGVAVMSLAFAWPALKRAFAGAFRSRQTEDDRDEPMSGRAAVFGLMICCAVLVAFGVALGLSWYIAVLFFAIFLLTALAYARMRAEAGFPWLFAPYSPSESILIDDGGTQNYGASSLVAFAYIRWFDNDYRNVAMPYQLEAMKMTDNTRLNPRHLTICILTGIVIATLASWVSILGLYYHYGAASAHVNGWRSWKGQEPFSDVQTWLQSHKPTDGPALAWTLIGFAGTVALSVLRARFAWWPFHPIGFAVANTATMDWLVTPTLIGWICKVLTVRYGGLQGYRKGLPFFIGLVLGDYAISAFWALFSLATGMPGYRTFPI